LKNFISKEKTKRLIDQYILDQNDESEFKIKEINPIDLIHSNRLDLGFKLFYLNLRSKCNKIAKKIYIDHIKTFSFGKFSEKGNKNKNNADDFIQSFENILLNLKKNGFDDKISLIPVNKNKVILNGSHRLASAIYLKKKIKTIELKGNILSYDYKFFLKRNIKIEYLEKSIKCFCSYNSRSRLAILWPSFFISGKDTNNYFDNIVYEKDINLTNIGKHNFVTEIYKNEKWLGDYENDFNGAKNKMHECFKTNKQVKIVIFNIDERININYLKSKIRNEIGIGKHSIHITDNNNFQNILDIIFNENSLHLLNTVKCSILNKQYNLTNILKKNLLKNNIDLDEVLIVGSFPLSLFEIRENRDLDIILLNDNLLETKNDFDIKISSHNNLLHLYGANKEELIYDDRNYFLFNDVKILKLDILKQFKENRKEKKDIIDVHLINKYNKSKRITLSPKIYLLKISYLYGYWRYRLILFLIKIKLYSMIRGIFKND